MTKLHFDDLTQITIERDEDGGNPTIELVEVGGKDA